MVRRTIQWLLRFAIALFLLAVIGVSATFIYIYFNREIVINRVSKTINEALNGELVMHDINVDFFHYFPGTAIHISGVSLRDSMFRFHKMEFFRAEDVYIKINFMEMFSPEPPLENITFKNGSIYIFNDSTGYSNKYLLQSKNKGTSPGINKWLKEINLKNFRFVFSNPSANRYHNIYFKRLSCGIHNETNNLTLSFKSAGEIKMLAFNLSKGTYAKDAAFNNNLIIYYNKNDSILEIPEHSFYLNDELLVAKALIHFNQSAIFKADINASRILFGNAIKFVTAKTQSRLSQYKLTRPLRIHVRMSGMLKAGYKPEVNVDMATAGNTITYREYTLNQCSFKAHYTNRSDTLKNVAISNNAFTVKKFSAQWNGIPLNADEIRVFNFPFPSVSAVVHGNFPLRNVNKLPGGGVYNFLQGSGSYHAIYSATSDSLSWKNNISLNVKIKDGALIYEPRGMAFQEINAGILIKNYDVFIQHASCRSGSSLLSLKGEAPGILNTDFKDLKQAQLNWEIKSAYINLEDFTTFLGSRKKLTITKSRTVATDKTNFGKHLERYLEDCKINMHLNIDAMRFDKFTATGLSGSVHLIDNKWTLDAINFNHADGSVKLSGKLIPVSENVNAVFIKSNLRHVNISEVFSAFGNFSQNTITSDQINGTLDAKVQLGFNMNNKAAISQASIEGRVDLSLSNGELKGFQPMGKLSKFLFRKRDFTDIRFSEITNSFVARGNEIYFDRMKINTSVMELYMEGSYFLDGKTDMRFQVPLSNLKNRDWSELSDNITDKGIKGMNVFIHATTDEMGELRFKYDPLKKIKDKRFTQ